jgi:hypothetical protein
MITAELLVFLVSDTALIADPVLSTFALRSCFVFLPHLLIELQMSFDHFQISGRTLESGRETCYL